MTDEVADPTNKVIDAMIEALRASTTPEMMQAQLILLRRLALSGSVIPSRIPAPRNITEVGGYFNLLETLQQPEIRSQTLAWILGVAGPNPALGWTPRGRPLWFVAQPNDRPAGDAQATLPTSFTVRSDFAGALAAALTSLHDQGAVLPILSPLRVLPAVGQPVGDLLSYVGRTLDLAPLAALNDPPTDPLAVGSPAGGGSLSTLARALAPGTTPVAAADWKLWKRSGAACTFDTYSGANALPMVELGPLLNAAGWYQPAPTPPTSASSPGNWAHWTNITGLVAGATRYGDELALLYDTDEVTPSSLRNRLDWLWNGTTFAAP